MRARTANFAGPQNIGRTRCLSPGLPLCRTRRFEAVSLVRVAVLAALSLSLSSCDAVYGVRRSTPLESAPDLACIESIIRTVPGVLGVRREDRELSTKDRYHYFIYDLGSTSGLLTVVVKPNGKATLEQADAMINRTPPQAEIDVIYPMMLRIERALEEKCGLGHLRIVEWSKGVKCETRSPEPNS